MIEHTPTPWKFSPNSFGTQFIYGDLERPLQTPMGISYFHLVTGGDHPSTLSEANAAFICKAVNKHDALVADNDRLRAAITELHHVWFKGPDADKNAVMVACLPLFRAAYDGGDVGESR